MAQYNIEMNSYDGSQYNQLYPQTNFQNIIDANDFLYTKETLPGYINQYLTDNNNKKFYIGNYIGSGTDNNTLHFDYSPDIIIIFRNDMFYYSSYGTSNSRDVSSYYGGVFFKGIQYTLGRGNGSSENIAFLNGDTFTSFDFDQFNGNSFCINSNGITYNFIAIST